MADLFVSPIVEIIIEKVASLIGEEFLAIQGVKKEAEKLSDSLRTIRAVLDDAEQRQQNDDCDTSLRVWLAKLKDAACDVEDILDIFATETHLWKREHQVRRIATSVSRLRFKSSVANKIKKISAKFEELAKEKNNFLLNASIDSGRPQKPPETTFFVDTNDVVGRDSDKERLIEQMLSNKSDAESGVCVIPIIGMGGLGKTTLAQLIFNHERVKRHFEFRMWVCVTVEFNLRKVLEKMMDMEPSNNLSTNILESRLRELLSEKNCNSCKFPLLMD